jgi:hypothetical protein
MMDIMERMLEERMKERKYELNFLDFETLDEKIKFCKEFLADFSPPDATPVDENKPVPHVPMQAPTQEMLMIDGNLHKMLSETRYGPTSLKPNELRKYVRDYRVDRYELKRYGYENQPLSPSGKPPDFVMDLLVDDLVRSMIADELIKFYVQMDHLTDSFVYKTEMKVLKPS